MEVPGSAELRDLYEGHYSEKGADGERYGRWRQLGAQGKADHVARLAASLERQPRSVVEIGCGDGVVLEELARRGAEGTIVEDSDPDGQPALCRVQPPRRADYYRRHLQFPVIVRWVPEAAS